MTTNVLIWCQSLQFFDRKPTVGISSVCVTRITLKGIYSDANRMKITQTTMLSVLFFTLQKKTFSRALTCRPHQRSISPSIYEQLLRAKIPKAQKDSQVKQLFALLGPASIKSASKMLVKLTPEVVEVYF